MKRKLKDVSDHAIELTRTSFVFDLMSGMVGAGFAAPDSSPGWFGRRTDRHYDYYPRRSPLAQALTWYELVVREIEANSDRMLLARTTRDIELAHEQGY